jgi:hypothetical protein
MRIWAGAVVACLLGVAAASAADPAVGWIDSFDGDDPKYYRILRGGRVVPIGLFTPIYQGDEVVVDHGTDKIRLAYDDGRLIDVVGRRTPAYVVQRTAALASPWSNLAAWAGDWFRTWQSESATTTSVHVRSSADGPISLPLLATGQARVVAGTRPLFLAWDGGTPPYDVRVRPANASEPLVSLNQVTEKRARTGNLALGLGSFRIEILDKAGRRAAAGFQAVERLPVEPSELRQSNLPTPMRRVLFSAWLASQERGVWLLEAYQMASADAGAYKPAGLLRDGLESSDAPTGAPASASE